MMSKAVNSSSENKNSNPFLKRVGIYAAVLGGVFLLGFAPMWLTARERASERDAARAELRLSRMQNHIATAAMDVRRGEYEPARVAASDFFTGLRAEVDNTTATSLNGQQRDALQQVLAQRDDTITLLARSDPATVDRLTDLYLAYTKVVGPAQQRQ